MHSESKMMAQMCSLTNKTRLVVMHLVRPLSAFLKTALNAVVISTC